MKKILYLIIGVVIFIGVSTLFDEPVSELEKKFHDVGYLKIDKNRFFTVHIGKDHEIPIDELFKFANKKTHTNGFITNVYFYETELAPNPEDWDVDVREALVELNKTDYSFVFIKNPAGEGTLKSK